MMASDETMTAVHDFVDDDYGFGDTRIHFMSDREEEKEEEDGDDIICRWMWRLPIEISDGGDAEAELSGEEEEEEEEEEENFDKNSVSTARTSLRGLPCVDAAKDHASETKARGRRGSRGRSRERWLQRSWEMKKRAAATEGLDSVAGGGGGACRVWVRPRGGVGTMCMDMEEVMACRDLGLELPCDWTVEIPSGHSGSTVDASSGDNSPVPSWKISSPGDDPENVKARLKVWAQVVALASAVDSLL